MNTTTDRADVEEVLNRVVEAHLARDASTIVDAYMPDAVIFDLAPPLGRRGVGRDLLATWLASWDGPIQLDSHEVDLIVEGNLAFVSLLNRMRGRKGGEDEDLWFRSTLCLRKVGGHWRIAFDHAPVPFYMDGSTHAAVDLKPEGR